MREKIIKRHLEANLNLKEDAGHFVAICCHFFLIYSLGLVQGLNAL